MAQIYTLDSFLTQKTQCVRVCHTPKFALMFLKTFHTSMLKDSSRVDQTNSLLDNQPKLGFGISQIKMDFQHLQWPSCLLICFKDSPYQVSKLHKSSFLRQLHRWLKISCIDQKVNCGQHTVKTSDFWSKSSF